MRIGIAFPYDFRRSGGVQEFSVNLAREMSNRGHEVTLIGPGAEVADVGVASLMGCLSLPVIGWHGTRFDATVMTPSQLRRAIGLNLDVLHVHEPLAPFMLRQLIKSSETPVVATVHSAGPTHWRRTRAMIYGRFGRARMDRVDRIIAVSETAAAWSHAYVRRHPQLIGLATPYPSGETTKRSQTPSDGRLRVLFLGRNEPRKNLRRLIGAVLLLDRQGRDVQLEVGGWRSERAMAWVSDAQLIERGVIRFVGQVSAAQRQELYSRSDVFCSPAVGGEAFGLAPLEAHLAGANLVLGDNPGYREAFGSCPTTTFCQGNVEALAEGLIAASCQPIGCTDSCPTAEAHSFSAVCDAYEVTYAEVVAGSGPERARSSAL